jgi:hypothetical protein
MDMIYKRGEILWVKYYCAGRPIRSRRRRGSGGSRYDVRNTSELHLHC